MANWNLKCPDCGSTFVHSKIEETLENYYFPSRPNVPAEGFTAKCPDCGKNANYQRTDFFFQKD